jgi:putative transposase
MKNDNVVALRTPEDFLKDPLTAVLRAGARKMLAEALEAEIEGYLEQFRELKDSTGRQRIVRNGYLPAREIQTGIGQVMVQVPRSRDREPDGAVMRFSSDILPPYLRRSRSIEELLPWLYLKGVSTGDFSDALKGLLGEAAPGLAASTISRLKAKWAEEVKAWRKRDLSDKRYGYIWVDGIYSNVRMADRQCLLVIIGVNERGCKELVALEDGYRESEQSWLSVLRDLVARGLKQAPALAIGDGSLGFWKAVEQVYGQTRHQRCWVHKTVNVLDKLPKSLQSKAKEKLQAIWMAPSKKEAEKHLVAFVHEHQAKYPKATDCLEKDKESLLAFYDFPAEHWRHIRTTNPIESTFATIRLRTAKVRNCFSSTTVVSMAFQLCLCAEKRWHKINGAEKLNRVMRGIKFVNGEEARRNAA